MRLAEIYLTAYMANPQVNKLVISDARAAIERLLKRNPRSYDGLRLDADLATAVNDRDKAIERLRQANAVRPWQPETITALMQNLALAGHQPEAEKMGQEFLTRNSAFGPVYDLLYLYSLRDSQPDRAETILKSKIANLPADGSSLVQLATFYYTRNRKQEMLATLDALRAARKALAHTPLLIGDFFFHINEPDSAIQSFREGVKEEPDFRSMYEKRIAVVLITQDRNDEAMQLASRLHKDDPKDVEAAAIEASLLAKVDRRQTQAAIDALEALASTEHGNAILEWTLGSAYRAKGDLQSLNKARQHLEASLNLDRNLLPARLALAEVQLARGENDSAVQIADEILKASPAHLPAKLVRAAGLSNTGQTKKAREELVNALGMYKGSPEASYQLAALDLVEQRYKEAETGFLELARAGDARGVLGLARSKELQGNKAAAVQIIERELTSHPDRDTLRLALVDLEYRLGNFAQARTHLTELARKNPESVDVQLRLADVMSRTGDQKGAIQLLRRTRQLKASDARPVLRLAVLLDATGQTEQARVTYEDVLKIDPENLLALNNLAYIQADAGVDLDQALGFAQRALRIAPNDPNVSDTLGLIYIRKKLTGQAVEVLRNVVTRAPENPGFHLHLGMALYDAGEKQLAKKELEAALRHKPSGAEETKIKELAAKIG